MNFLTDEIKTESDAQGFFFALYQIGKLFDPAADPADVVDADGRKSFDANEAALVRARIDEAFSVMDDPREYALSLKVPATDKDRAYGPHA